jgi:hypothetical protein
MEDAFFKVLPGRGGGLVLQIEHSLLLFSTHIVRDCRDSQLLLVNTEIQSHLLTTVHSAVLSVGTR